MNKNLRKAMLAGLGALTMTEQLSKKLLVELVKRGAVSEKEAKTRVNKLVKEAVEAKSRLEKNAEAEVKKLIKKLDIATISDLQNLEKKLKKKKTKK